MMGAYAQSDFDTLYRDSYNNLLRLAYRSTKDYHESEDLVDEAFVIYLQKSEIVHINNPRAYLVKIMSNLICNCCTFIIDERLLRVNHMRFTFRQSMVSQEPLTCKWGVHYALFVIDCRL